MILGTFARLALLDPHIRVSDRQTDRQTFQAALVSWFPGFLVFTLREECMAVSIR